VRAPPLLLDRPAGAAERLALPEAPEDRLLDTDGRLEPDERENPEPLLRWAPPPVE